MLTDMFLTRGRLPISSFLCFVGGFSMGSWLTLFHQLQVERDLVGQDSMTARHHEPMLLMVVLILSAPSNFDFRDTLRHTWLRLNPSRQSTRHVFAIGTEGLDEEMLRKLHQENTIQNDLLFLPIHDSFANLTLKLKESLAYLHSSMASKYLLKLDDDSFARLNVIVGELEDREARGNSDFRQKCYYWGFFHGSAQVKKGGKWKETDYNLCDLYIPYALGGGYVLSKACVDFIAQNRHVLREYTNEDTTMGTWLSVLPAERRHDVRFDTEYKSRGCSNRYLVQHKISQAQMIERYKNLITYDKLCLSEYRKRESYEYDWTVPPSQCCRRNASII